MNKDQVIDRIKEVHKHFIEFLENKEVFKSESKVDALAIAVTYRAIATAFESDILEHEKKEVIEMYYQCIGAAMTGEWCQRAWSLSQEQI